MRFPQERMDRGVSEVLSYILIFGIIITSIAVLSLAGFNLLDDVRTNEKLSNAERAFDLLDQNFEEVYTGGAPSRTTEISLGTSQLFFGDNITLSVVTEDRNNNFTRRIRPIIFRVQEDRRLVYAAGAVIRANDQGGFMLSDPPFRFTDDTDRVNIPIVETTSPDVQSIGGGTVLVRGQLETRELLSKSMSSGSKVANISIKSPRYRIWADYFENQGYCTSVDRNNPPWTTCEIDSTTIQEQIITAQRIQINLLS